MRQAKAAFALAVSTASAASFLAVLCLPSAVSAQAPSPADSQAQAQVQSRTQSQVQPQPQAQPLSTDPQFTRFAADFYQLSKQDARIQAIGWRLISRNATICTQTRRDIGLNIEDAQRYNHPEWVRQIIGSEEDFFVQSPIADTPAANAGVMPLDVVTALDGHPLHPESFSEEQNWRRLRAIEDLLQQSLASGSVDISFANNGTHSIPAQLVCDSRFELVSGRDGAYADGSRVRIGRDFPALEYAEDELAAAIAHELAHNLLAHPQWLEAHGRRRSDVRETEREADRLAVWLLANAGYKPAAMTRLLKRWGPRHDGGLFRKRTHDSWRDRVQLVDAELAVLYSEIRAGLGANWSGRFVRRTQ